MACQCIPNEKCAKFVELVVETCAYAGSGNVLKVQQMLHLCAEHKEDKESIYQVAAVIGVALIAFGEEIGTEMAMRTMQHLLQYGEPTIKRTVPLAMGLLRISHPEIGTMDLLNKLAYDSDAEVSMSAIFALGLIGAGTNNSKLAGNLRFLAQYYSGQSTENQLFIVRIAQGLVHLGKGLLGLNPMHSDKFLFSNVSLAGLLTVLYAATDIKTFIAGKYHYMLYYLTLSIYPRMLITVSPCNLTNLTLIRSMKTWKQSTRKCVSAKPSTQLVKPASPRKSQASRRTTHQCSFSKESAQSLPQRNSSARQQSSRTSRSSGQTPTTTQNTTT